MAQVILHPRDNENIAYKDWSRNLSLQSIVSKENEDVAQSISRSNIQRQEIERLVSLLEELQSLLNTYVIIANKIYQLITTAYIVKNYVSQRDTIQNEAKGLLQ